MALARLRLTGPQASVQDYYLDDAVRARILEALGGTAHHPPTAAFVIGFDERLAARPGWEHAVPRPASDLPAILAQGLDVSRSLWDTASLMFFMEIDYLNVDHPAEPFVHPADVFLNLEAAYRAVTAVFASLGLRARAFVSGRGYHFVGRIPLADRVVGALAALPADTPPWYATHAARRPAAVTAPLTEPQARASEGLGRAIEYAAHLVLARATPVSPIPVVVNGTVVGQGMNGRAAASIDFSHFGDPLDVRHLRTAFSAYQWHRHRPDIFGAVAAGEVPPLAVIPRGRHSLMTLLQSGRDLAGGASAARAGSALLANVAAGVGALVAAYATSPLAGFHREFDADRRKPAPQPALDRLALPPCVAAPLARPNDLLLKPEHVQHLVRALLSRGWSAAGVAALVQAAYEGDHGWGDRWRRSDARTRADFDVRVFAGLVRTGADTLVDFNCVSAQEKGLCPGTDCRYDLRRDRNRLEELAAS